MSRIHTADNKANKAVRHALRMEKQAEKVLAVPRGSARLHREKKEKANGKHTYITPIRAAFDRIKVMNSANTEQGRIIAGHIMDAITSKAHPGMFKVNDVSIDVSFRTYQQLKAQEVMA